MKIGATIRSDHADYLERHYGHSEIALYGSPVEATLDLLVGRIDAVFGDKRALVKFLESREGECCRILGTAPDKPAYTRQFYGVGLRKEDGELKDRFDEALAARAGGRHLRSHPRKVLSLRHQIEPPEKRLTLARHLCPRTASATRIWDDTGARGWRRSVSLGSGSWARPWRATSRPKATS